RYRAARRAGSGPAGDSLRTLGDVCPRAQGSRDRAAGFARGDFRHPAGVGRRQRGAGPVGARRRRASAWSAAYQRSVGLAAADLKTARAAAPAASELAVHDPGQLLQRLAWQLAADGVAKTLVDPVESGHRTVVQEPECGFAHIAAGAGLDCAEI